MKWEDRFNIGVELVDHQHQKLFRMINDFEDILKEDVSDEEKKRRCKNAVIFMKAYVIMHFSDEEQYQQSIGYSGYKEHKKIHDDFTASVLTYEERLENSEYDLNIVKEFAELLEEWLLNHVSEEDQKIVE